MVAAAMSHNQQHVHCSDPWHIVRDPNRSTRVRGKRLNHVRDRPKKWARPHSAMAEDTLVQCGGCRRRYTRRGEWLPPATVPPPPPPPLPNPLHLTATAFTFARPPSDTSRLFITDSAVLNDLYCDSTAHPGLSYWQLDTTDHPSTGLQRPPHLKNDAANSRTTTYRMPVVPFDLPSADSTEVGTAQRLFEKNTSAAGTATDERVMSGVLELVKERPMAAEGRHTQEEVNSSRDGPTVVTYQKDIERHSAWQKPSFIELKRERQLNDVFPSPFNPHRFALSVLSLLYLLPRLLFLGFAVPSWYVKTAGSFFCLHVEQLFAPFYNLCYEGSTTWYVVRGEDRERLNAYIVERAKQWYGVPDSGVLSEAEGKAVQGLLYTKRVLFHPDDLVAAGIHLTKVVQRPGQVVLGRGDCVHFGLTTVPADRELHKNARSVNEAVNFMPVEWLQSGLPQLVEWLAWLDACWLPTQDKHKALQSDSSARLRAAMHDSYTNQLVAHHCPIHIARSLLQEIRLCLPADPPQGAVTSPTRDAIQQYIGTDEQLRKAIKDAIDEALRLMELPAMRRWLLHFNKVGKNGDVVLIKYEDE